MRYLRAAFDGFTLVHGILTLIAGVFHVWFWIRRGFWVPRYVHMMAAIATLIGVGLLRILPPEAPARGQGVLGYIFTVLVFPALVYGTFVVLGGVEAAADVSSVPDEDEGD